MEVLRLTGVVLLVAVRVTSSFGSTSLPSKQKSLLSSVRDSEPAASGKMFTMGEEVDDLDGFAKNFGKKGSDGYKNKDKYHKRDGDSYGFSSGGGFSLGDGDAGGGAYHQSYSYDSDDAKATKATKAEPSYKEWHYEKKKGQPARRSYYSKGKQTSDEMDDEMDDFEFGAESRTSPIMFPSSDVDILSDMAPGKFQSLSDTSQPLRTKKQTDGDYGDDYEGDEYDGESEGGADTGDDPDPVYASYDDGESASYDVY